MNNLNQVKDVNVMTVEGKGIITKILDSFKSPYDINKYNASQQKEFIKFKPSLVLFLKQASSELIRFALNEEPDLIDSLPKEYQTKEVCRKAIVSNPKNLAHIVDQDDIICRFAVNIDLSSVQYIKDKSIQISILEELENSHSHISNS